jgi:SAM-dependent methyltransferase
MNWRYKAVLQNVIAALPFSNAIYYGVQRISGDLRPSRFDPMEWFEVAGRMLRRLRSVEMSIAGRYVLEVGTGRALGVPTALWLCGAGKITTVDLNQYLSPGLVGVCNRFLCGNADRVREVLAGSGDESLFRDRIQRIQSFTGDLSSFLKLIDTKYLAPGDAGMLPLPDHSVDLHFSYSVFEHVPVPQIRTILREARRVLRPNGVVIHGIDLSDHFSYFDSSITKINFLRFSDQRWKRWAGNQYMYHNRLRASEMIKLFEEAGVQINGKSEALDKRSLDEIRRGFPLDARFRSMSPEELAITNINVMGRFSDTAEN